MGEGCIRQRFRSMRLVCVDSRSWLMGYLARRRRNQSVHFNKRSVVRYYGYKSILCRQTKECRVGKSYIMTSESLQLHDLTPESGHELTPDVVSRPPSPEMGYESLVNESRSGDSISRTATLVCLSITLHNG